MTLRKIGALMQLGFRIHFRSGKLIGAIGCSGSTGSQDEVACKEGAAIIK